MLILKIALQIFSVLSTWVIARLDYSFGRETVEFRKGRFGLFTILLVISLLNIIVTIHDDQEKNQEIQKRDTKIAELTEKVEDLKNELKGGDSFCYLIPRLYMYTSMNEPRRDNDIEFWLRHDGKYPLYDIQIRVFDFQRIEKVHNEHLRSPMPLEKYDAESQINYHIDRLDPGFSKFVAKWVFPEKVNNYKIDIQFVARNGSWGQQMRFMRNTSGTWGTVSRTMRMGKVLVEHGGELTFPYCDFSK